jgi:uncharacterized membrane protein YdfJ with MMPL/SSD domain
MPIILSSFTVTLVAISIFVPIFVIALVLLRSLLAAFSLAAVFALGSACGFMLTAMVAQLAIGHSVDSATREALFCALATSGAVAGGVLAVWAVDRKNKNRPWRRS